MTHLVLGSLNEQSRHAGNTESECDHVFRGRRGSIGEEENSMKFRKFGGSEFGDEFGWIVSFDGEEIVHVDDGRSVLD